MVYSTWSRIQLDPVIRGNDIPHIVLRAVYKIHDCVGRVFELDRDC